MHGALLVLLQIAAVLQHALRQIGQLVATALLGLAAVAIVLEGFAIAVECAQGLVQGGLLQGRQLRAQLLRCFGHADEAHLPEIDIGAVAAADELAFRQAQLQQGVAQARRRFGLVDAALRACFAIEQSIANQVELVLGDHFELDQRFVGAYRHSGLRRACLRLRRAQLGELLQIGVVAVQQQL